MLRLVAASMVVVGHAWPLTGLADAPQFAGIRIHHLGVYVFFAISGHLLATSWQRDSRALSFLIRRCARIFPALLVVVALSVFVIGPLATSARQPGYWSSPDTWQYLLSAVLLAQYDLPDVFASNPETTVNGSLWSLGVEFCCYLMLVGTALLGRRIRMMLQLVLVLSLGSAVLLGLVTGPMHTTAVAVVFFMLGAFAARGSELSTWPIWPAVVGLVLIAPLQGRAGTLLAWPVVVYVVVAVGSHRSAAAGIIRRLGDPSYGIYLWGYIVQQLVVEFTPRMPLAWNVLTVLGSTAVLGFASWHLLEKRAVALGARLSARDLSLPRHFV
ncbi:acyltransferase family protein [Microbacterium sp. NPDC057650]|uniref:acyltransferase family protein n=1 Tax=unclassified Microbacterium TaxID=2609290 RepID=UPI003672A2A6